VPVRLARGRLGRWGAGQQELVERSLRALQQSLGGVKEVAATGSQLFFHALFARHQRALGRLRRREATLGDALLVVVESAGVISLAVVALVATRARDGTVDPLPFFTVPTAQLRVLFVLVVLAHHRRRVLHFNVTEHPTAAWTAQQIVDTFPDDTAPAYLLRDRDAIYGDAFRQRMKGMRIQEVLTAARSPWQNPFAERLIGSIRRDCLDHVIVLSERHLRRILTRYFAYYNHTRTHLSLTKDAPDGRPIELSQAGRIVEIPEVGGLHHRYTRRAA
jgi:transposase InsO family protein